MVSTRPDDKVCRARGRAVARTLIGPHAVCHDVPRVLLEGAVAAGAECGGPGAHCDRTVTGAEEPAGAVRGAARGVGRTATAAADDDVLCMRCRLHRAQMADDYVEKVRLLHAWIDAKTAEFASPSYGQSIEDVQAQLLELHNYRRGVKPEKTALKSALATQLRNLIAKQRQERAPVFTPPQNCQLQDTEDKWQGLMAVEMQYENGLHEALRNARARNKALSRLRAQLERLHSWMEQKQIYLNDTNLGSSHGEVDGNLKKHEAHMVECKLYMDRAQDLFAEGEPFPELAADIESARATLSAIETGSNERTAALNERLEYYKHFMDLCTKFAAEAEAINGAFESIDDRLKEPVTAYSMNDVELLESECDAASQQLDALRAEIDSLAAIQTELGNDVVNPYSRFSLEQIYGKFAQLEQTLHEQRTQVAVERDRQNDYEALRTQFATQADQFSAWIGQHTRALGDISGTSSDPQKRLQELKSTLDAIEQQGREFLHGLEVLNQQLVANAVVENQYTRHTLEDLTAEFDALKSGYQGKIGLVEEKIITEKGMEVKPEQIAEFKEAFQYFDKTHSNALSKEEFRQVCDALGQDLSAAQLDDTFARLDSDHNGKVGRAVARTPHRHSTNARLVRRAPRADLIQRVCRVHGWCRPRDGLVRGYSQCAANHHRW